MSICLDLNSINKPIFHVHAIVEETHNARTTNLKMNTFEVTEYSSMLSYETKQLLIVGNCFVDRGGYTFVKHYNIEITIDLNAQQSITSKEYLEKQMQEIEDAVKKAKEEITERLENLCNHAFDYSNLLDLPPLGWDDNYTTITSEPIENELVQYQEVIADKLRMKVIDNFHNQYMQTGLDIMPPIINNITS